MDEKITRQELENNFNLARGAVRHTKAFLDLGAYRDYLEYENAELNKKYEDIRSDLRIVIEEVKDQIAAARRGVYEACVEQVGIYEGSYCGITEKWFQDYLASLEQTEKIEKLAAKNSCKHGVFMGALGYCKRCDEEKPKGDE